MVGNNKLTLNLATMMAAVEYYLKNEMFSDEAFNVVAIPPEANMEKGSTITLEGTEKCQAQKM